VSHLSYVIVSAVKRGKNRSSKIEIGFRRKDSDSSNEAPARENLTRTFGGPRSDDSSRGNLWAPLHVTFLSFPPYVYAHRWSHAFDQSRKSPTGVRGINKKDKDNQGK